MTDKVKAFTPEQIDFKRRDVVDGMARHGVDRWLETIDERDRELVAERARTEEARADWHNACDVGRRIETRLTASEAENARLRAALQRLTEARDVYLADGDSRIAPLEARVAASDAENERLRAALDTAADAAQHRFPKAAEFAHSVRQMKFGACPTCHSHDGKVHVGPCAGMYSRRGNPPEDMVPCPCPGTPWTQAEVDATKERSKALDEIFASPCTCAAIQAADHRRHFRECPEREKYPEATKTAEPAADFNEAVRLAMPSADARLLDAAGAGKATMTSRNPYGPGLVLWMALVVACLPVFAVVAAWQDFGPWRRRTR